MDARFLRFLETLIQWAVRLLALLMVAVIVLGVLEVGYTLYEDLLTPPVGLVNITDILPTFGGFMAVLIAIEIFHNIVLYLRREVIHMRLVLGTALMAIARKVIVLDTKQISAVHVFAIAAVMLAAGAAYYLVVLHGARGTTVPTAQRRHSHAVPRRGHAAVLP